MITDMAKIILTTAIGTRRYYYRMLSNIAKDVRECVILEIGSGKKGKNGRYPYSAKHLFDDSNDFICTDIDSTFGHAVLDITTMECAEVYDVVLCLNVLEHIFDIKLSVDNIYNSLKSGGRACFAVPVLFPLHDEPHDYWRFTEHSIRKLLADFDSVTIGHWGCRKFPFGYFVDARKENLELKPRKAPFSDG